MPTISTTSTADARERLRRYRADKPGAAAEFDIACADDIEHLLSEVDRLTASGAAARTTAVALAAAEAALHRIATAVADAIDKGATQPYVTDPVEVIGDLVIDLKRANDTVDAHERTITAQAQSLSAADARYSDLERELAATRRDLASTQEFNGRLLAKIDHVRAAAAIITHLAT